MYIRRDLLAFNFFLQWGAHLVAANNFLAVLCRALVRAGGARQAAALGLVFASAWLSSTFWWLYVSMTYGGLHALLTVAAVAALAAALGLYYAIACAVFWHLSQKGLWLAAGVFAAAWTAAELARGTWLTGFGWGAIGYAHVQGPLAAFVPWLGSYGVAHCCMAGRRSGPGWVDRRSLASALAALMADTVACHWSQTAGTALSCFRATLRRTKSSSRDWRPNALLWYREQLLQPRRIGGRPRRIPRCRAIARGYWQALQRQFSSEARPP